MRFAICNETFQDWPFDKAFRFAADLGYTGLEIAPFTIKLNAYEISQDERSQVRRQAEDAGLEIIGLHGLPEKPPAYFLPTPDVPARHKTADSLAELARLCRDLGGHLMVLGSPLQRNLLPGVTHEQAMELAADCLRGAMPTLEDCGVTLAVEPLGPKDGNFLLTADAGRQLCEMVASPNCRLHLDCKAMASELKPIPQLIRENPRLLAHFHANDPNMRGPGMGDLDFAPIFKALADIDYRGWVSVEVFDYTPGVESLARDSIAYMQDCLARLAR